MSLRLAPSESPFENAVRDLRVAGSHRGKGQILHSMSELSRKISQSGWRPHVQRILRLKEIRRLIFYGNNLICRQNRDPLTKHLIRR